MKFPTMDEMAKQVVKMAKEELTINNMTLAEFLIKVDEVAGFLQSEISRAEERMEINGNYMYDGVKVGEEQQKILNKSHIRFCKTILKILGVEEC